MSISTARRWPGPRLRRGAGPSDGRGGRGTTVCAIYARYSSALQREASIEDQVRLCRERAGREGWTVVEVFADRATSGASMLRPGLQGLLEEARSGSDPTRRGR
ncbi:MAG: recombinase family protein [Paracoccaceae bacterium]